MKDILFLKGTFDVQDHLWYDQDFKSTNSTSAEYVYPVLIDTTDFDNWSIPSFVDTTKTKILFIQTKECGFASKTGDELTWLSKITYRYKLNLLLITSDHLIQDKFDNLLKQGRIKDNFKVKAFTYFKNTLWFHDYFKNIDEVFKLSLGNNKNKKEFHFLNFNRVTKKHRVCIFGELMTNPYLTGKFITSLGHNVNIRNVDYINEVETVLENFYNGKQRLLEFFKTYNPTTHYTYDETDLENSKAANLNVDAHNRSFVNIVTESSYEDNFIFLTEKTFKPIYCAQPFILIGNPHSLKKLRELGFKTFSQWWDESYDEELNFTKRYKKIVKLMEDISSWSLDECLDITQQMEEVFIHNFNILISKTEQNEVKKLLRELI
jgi:hypothetical protein